LNPEFSALLPVWNKYNFNLESSERQNFQTGNLGFFRVPVWNSTGFQNLLLKSSLEFLLDPDWRKMLDTYGPDSPENQNPDFPNTTYDSAFN